MQSGQMHEDYSREEAVAGPSDRKFGLTIAVVFGLIAALKLYQGSSWFWLWTGLGAAMLAAALWLPALLARPNAAWLKLGLLLYRVVNPVVMAVLFYLTILPIGLLLRLFGKDLLRLKWDRAAGTYWLPRTDGRPPAESMRQQF